MNRMDREKLRLQDELEQKTREREECLRKYLEVSREKKILEKLKERKQAQYYVEQKVEEFKSLDETNSCQTIRKGLSL